MASVAASNIADHTPQSDKSPYTHHAQFNSDDSENYPSFSTQLPDEARIYKTPNPHHCIFNAATRMALRVEANSKHPDNPSARQKHRRKLERALGAFYKAAILLGCAGRVPAKAFRIAMTVDPWPRNEGEPRYKYHAFRELVRTFTRLGILNERDGLIVFEHWSVKTHPSQAEVHALKKQAHGTSARFGLRKCVEKTKRIPAYNRQQGYLRPVLKSQRINKYSGLEQPQTQAAQAFEQRMRQYESELAEQVARDLAFLSDPRRAEEDALLATDAALHPGRKPVDLSIYDREPEVEMPQPVNDETSSFTADDDAPDDKPRNEARDTDSQGQDCQLNSHDGAPVLFNESRMPLDKSTDTHAADPSTLAHNPHPDGSPEWYEHEGEVMRRKLRERGDT